MNKLKICFVNPYILSQTNDISYFYRLSRIIYICVYKTNKNFLIGNPKQFILEPFSTQHHYG